MHGFIMVGCELAIEFCDKHSDRHYMILGFLFPSFNKTLLNVKIKVDTNLTYCGSQEIESLPELPEKKWDPEDWWISDHNLWFHI